MLSRSTLRSSRSALACTKAAQRRTYADTTSKVFTYELSESAGTKIVSRDLPGAVSTLALVSKAGTRYQWAPGLAEALEKFAFRNTQKRFAVRIVRESELLGSQLFTDRSREAIVYGAQFLKEDLPYFVELFAEVASETKYQEYMLHEVIEPVVAESQLKFANDPTSVALNAAHSVAFHRGLGNQLYPTSSHFHVQAAEVEAYAAAAFSKSNFALIGSGIDKAELGKWTGEFFKDISSSAPAGLPSLESAGSKYYGGEERIHGKKNAIVLAFPGTGLSSGNAYKPEYEVLSTLLGGPSSIKRGTGTSIVAKAIAPHSGVSGSTDLHKYSDTGLLTITLTGPAKSLTAAAKDVVASLKTLSRGSISKEDFKKAAANAKFKVSNNETAGSPAFDLIGLNAITNGKVQSFEEATSGVGSVSESAVSQAAKKLLSGKATLATVGDLQELPYAEELGIDV